VGVLPAKPFTAIPIAVAMALAGLLASGGAASADAHSTHRPAAAIGLAHQVGARSAAMHAKSKRSWRRAQNRRGVSRAVALASRSPSRAPSPTQPSGLLFNGAHISDFDELQAAPGAITEVPDPAGSSETDFQMTVSNQDVYPVTPTDNPRAQALSPPVIHPGDEIWLQTKFMLPQNLPTVKGWMSLIQIYGAPFDGSSPWEIDVAENEILWQRNGTYDWDIPWRMPLVKDRWISVLLHERFADDGWVEMWIDGQPVDFFEGGTRLSMQTMDSSNNGGPNAAKIMNYREAGMFDSASVYFGPLKLGTTRASVGG
jgi:hypothetical protein